MGWFFKKQPLKSKNPAERRRAIETLAVSNNPTVLQALVAAMGERDAGLRRAAAEALGRFKAGAFGKQLPAVSRVLARALRDPDIDVRLPAAMALKKQDWQPEGQEQMAIFQIALGNLKGAARLGAPAVEVLLAELRHPRSFQRRATAEALGEMEDERIIMPLLGAIDDKDTVVKVSAIKALARNDSAEVTMALQKTLWDGDPNARLTAAEVLLDRADASFSGEFSSLISDQHFEVRLVAVKFFAKINDRKLCEQLLPLLSDSDHDVRRLTIQTLGVSKNPEFIGPLIMSLVDSERPVREAAIVALDLIDPRWALSPAAKEKLPEVERALQDADPWVRLECTKILTRLKGTWGDAYNVWKAKVIPLKEEEK